MKRILSFALLISLIGCTTTPVQQRVPRILVLDGDAFIEEEIGAITSWKCSAYVSDCNVQEILSSEDWCYGTILVEVGTFENQLWEKTGFVLYEGSNKGKLTHYKREGLNRRWDWDKYSVIIKPDGGGAYLDFTNVPAGESTHPDSVYKCTQ